MVLLNKAKTAETSQERLYAGQKFIRLLRQNPQLHPEFPDHINGEEIQ